MTNAILTDEQRTAIYQKYGTGRKEGFDAAAAELESATLDALVQRAGVEAVGCGYVVRYERGDTPSTAESGYAQILGTAVYPPEAIAQLQARIEALSAQLETQGEVVEFMDWRTKLAEMVDAYIQGEYEGEGQGDEAYKALKEHILATPFATPSSTSGHKSSVSNQQITRADSHPVWATLEQAALDWAKTHSAPAASHSQDLQLPPIG